MKVNKQKNQIALWANFKKYFGLTSFNAGFVSINREYLKMLPIELLIVGNPKKLNSMGDAMQSKLNESKTSRKEAMESFFSMLRLA